MSEIRTGRRFPFAIVPLWVMDDPSIEALDIAVYVAIKRHADVQGEAYPSRQTIARLAKVSVSTVDRAVERLVAVNALEKHTRKHPNGDPASNLYLIHEAPTRPSWYVPERGGSVSQTVGVASEGRTELDPLRTRTGEPLNLEVEADPSEWTLPSDEVRARVSQTLGGSP
jgi:DNA-binding transcriptional MocR family regulator